MADYRAPNPRRNGNGVLLLAVVVGALMIICGAGLSASQTVQETSCTTYSCTITNIPVTATYGP